MEPVEFTGTGPWMTVVNPDVFMTWCAQCGEKFRKGGKAQRVEGGYGYRCDRHLTGRAGNVRAGECGDSNPAGQREVNKVNQQVSGGGSGI